MTSRILMVALLASSAMATTFLTCEKGSAPKEIRVKGCDDLPCTIKRGEDVVAEVDFVAGKNIKNLNVKVRATVLGVTVDYPLPEPNACKSLVDSACPLEAGDLATYKLQLPIASIIPTNEIKIYDLRFKVKPKKNNLKVKAKKRKAIPVTGRGGHAVVVFFEVETSLIDGDSNEVVSCFGFNGNVVA